MRRIALLAVTAALCGCSIPTLNSQSTNHSTTEMKKCCGCAGMDHCQKNADGTTCCKPDDCSCSQVTNR